jgi:hypothetical protein
VQVELRGLLLEIRREGRSDWFVVRVEGFLNSGTERISLQQGRHDCLHFKNPLLFDSKLQKKILETELSVKVGLNIVL